MLNIPWSVTLVLFVLVIVSGSITNRTNNLSDLEKLAKVRVNQSPVRNDHHHIERRSTDESVEDDVDEYETTPTPTLSSYREPQLVNFYPSRRAMPTKKKDVKEKLQIGLKPGSPEVTSKPTKYHYYPHNQHIYLLPECAIQQVCNAVYVRLNYTQPLCACPSRKEPCSASLNNDDLHTTELVTATNGKVLTLVKTCEPVAEMRECRAPRDWSLLALQNIRTGKSHYLVICRCPDTSRLEGPMSHDQPAYASVPGIRVYGMMCVKIDSRLTRPLRVQRSISDVTPALPWEQIRQLSSTLE